MSRTTWNTLVDATAYFGLIMLASTGLMLRYQLPPGSGGLHGVGIGLEANHRPVTVVWGLSRHAWGNIHYWIALFLLGVLAVHLVLHWKWIASVMGKKTHPDASGIKFLLGIAGLVLFSLLAAVPLVVPTESAPRSQMLDVQNETQQLDSADEEKMGPANESRSIHGSMTLEEVARQSGVPVREILDRLKLPPDTASSERVGRLLRSHGLEMQSLKKVLGQDEASR
ncbi:MAG: DUF4405 domain-containing protein [Pirellulaceae bacterium]|nr:DUF4405 domain-containing protein [Pirellulaceae bacterium]